ATSQAQSVSARHQAGVSTDHALPGDTPAPPPAALPAPSTPRRRQSAHWHRARWVLATTYLHPPAAARGGRRTAGARARLVWRPVGSGGPRGPPPGQAPPAGQGPLGGGLGAPPLGGALLAGAGCSGAGGTKPLLAWARQSIKFSIGRTDEWPRG